MIPARAKIALKRVLPALERHLFAAKPLQELVINGTPYTIQYFVKGKVRCVDIGNYRFLTQNPEKRNKWGSDARRGDRITWIISRQTSNFLGRCVNGEVEIFGE